MLHINYQVGFYLTDCTQENRCKTMT